MKEILINCASFSDKAALHRALAEGLEFPEWYGHNLDALYDCLTELQEPTRLRLARFTDFGGFRETMADAMAENPLVEILFE